MSPSQRCLLLLLVCCLGDCAAPCTWQGDTCLAVEITGELTAREGVLQLGLRAPGITPPQARLPEAARLPLLVTTALPEGIAAEDVSSVLVCAKDAENSRSYAGSAWVQWSLGSHVQVGVRLEPTASSPCVPEPQRPVQVNPEQPVSSPRFVTQRTPIQGLAPLTGAALGDFFDSGRKDLAAIGATWDTVLLFPARGDGSFETASTSQPRRIPDKLLAADVDGDGRSDLVGTSRSLGVALSYLREGKGRLATSFQVPFTQMGAAPADLAMMDVAGDSRPELVLANSKSPGEVLVVSLADGRVARYSSGGEFPESLAGGDLNGDGRKDLVVANHGSGETRILINDASGMLLTGPQVTQCTGPVALDVADYNRDGRPDIAVLCRTVPMVQVLLATASGPAGSFAAPITLPLSAQPHSLRGGDFNLDGHRDLAVLHDSGTLSFYLSDGQHGFRAELWPMGFGRNTTSLLADDLNGDDRPDLLIVGEQEIISLLAD